MSEKLKYDEKKLVVDRIKNGTVIDHIPAGKAFLLVEILNLSKNDKIMIGTNLFSEKMGKKDIIKVEDKEFTTEQIKSLAIVSRNITFSLIRNGERIKKTQVTLPQKINNIIKCPNDMCITVNENINSNFELVKIKGKDKLRCLYCERMFKMEQMSKYINLKKAGSETTEGSY